MVHPMIHAITRSKNKTTFLTLWGLRLTYLLFHPIKSRKEHTYDRKLFNEGHDFHKETISNLDGIFLENFSKSGRNLGETSFAFPKCTSRGKIPRPFVCVLLVTCRWQQWRLCIHKPSSLPSLLPLFYSMFLHLCDANVCVAWSASRQS